MSATYLFRFFRSSIVYSKKNSFRTFSTRFFLSLDNSLWNCSIVPHTVSRSWPQPRNVHDLPILPLFFEHRVQGIQENRLAFQNSKFRNSSTSQPWRHLQSSKPDLNLIVEKSLRVLRLSIRCRDQSSLNALFLKWLFGSGEPTTTPDV